jgi:UDP-N-acetyl-D-glucosamine dehydrogenase
LESASAQLACEDRESHRPKVVVIGMGYVGLPLVVELCKAGFTVTGYDKDREKVRLLGNGASRTSATSPPSDLAPLVVAGQARKASTDPDVLGRGRRHHRLRARRRSTRPKSPDMRFIVAATDEIAAQHQHPGMLIVLESHDLPGHHREVMVPRLTKGKVRAGQGRVRGLQPRARRPGQRAVQARRTRPRSSAALTPECLEGRERLYGNIIDTLVPVSSTDAAEMVKLLENTFRAVNIGLVNEVALMCNKLGLDVWEVIDAAASKPFGFMPFYPGPGLGGHCIPIDPLYLSWKLRSLKYNAQFIELADTINRACPATWCPRAPRP